ncbi:MAG: DUF411 domain-containing protein [Vicinamibacterales bacterium]
MNIPYTRRYRWTSTALVALALAWTGGVWIAAQPAKPGRPQLTVFKSATCGCCRNWVEHMRTNGFDVRAIDVDDIDAVKREHGVPASAASCHTGIVNGYVIEGHVPADAVHRLLREKPAVAGIAVPGMPVGSPGMEVPGGQTQPYAIVSIDKGGKTAIYERR